MEIITNILDLNKAIYNFKNIGFVPTMGGIHKGHLYLIKNSQKKCKKTLVSIFVNPTQFNDKNDYKNYPRNLNNDIKILKKHKVDYLFIPKVKDLYKIKMKKFILKNSEKVLCAKSRKGHFEGVLDVMNRLLSLVKSKFVFMGEKDFQQFLLIKKILGKKYKTNIIACKTIRDKNKIALSTRNKLLSRNSIKVASNIAKKLLQLKKNSILSNLRFQFNLSNIRFEFEKKYKIKIDYLEFRDEKKLKLNNFKSKYRLFIAYNINNIRLIDNF